MSKPRPEPGNGATYAPFTGSHNVLEVAACDLAPAAPGCASTAALASARVRRLRRFREV